MAAKILPSVDILREIIEYDSNTGLFTWKERDVSMFDSLRIANSWNSRYANKEAFTVVNAQGYKTATIFDSNYKAHRVAWKMFYGCEPIDLIDHINGVRTDNRIENLREANYSENRINTRGSRGVSGYKGVLWSSQRNKWVSEIKHNGKRIYLGLFDDPKDASAAYIAAAKCIHGDFACSESGAIQ